MVTRVIFIGAYAAIAIGHVPFFRIDRPGAALIGAVLMVATGAISLEAAAHAVDPRTLVLLFSMMVIVAYLRMSGGLASLADVVGRSATGPRQLVAWIVFTAGLLSALFVNDTVCLVFTPIVLDIAAARGQQPLPYLVALATASNIGSAATITGNPQNILIGSLSGIGFARFVERLGPMALVCLAVDAALICLVFRRQLSVRLEAKAAPPRRRVHRLLLAKTLVVSAAVLVGFLAGLDTATVAAAGAAALLVTRRVRPPRCIEPSIGIC